MDSDVRMPTRFAAPSSPQSRFTISCARGSAMPLKWCMSNQTVSVLNPHSARSSTYRSISGIGASW